MTVPKIDRSNHPAGSARAEHFNAAQVQAERHAVTVSTPARLGYWDPVPNRYAWVTNYLEEGRWWREPALSRETADIRSRELREAGNLSARTMSVSDEYEDHPMYHQVGVRTW